MGRLLAWIGIGLCLLGRLPGQGSRSEWGDLDELLEDPFLSSAKSADSTNFLSASQSTDPLMAEDSLYEKPLPPPPLRLIDSPRYTRLTLNPRVNKRIRTTGPFQVQLVRPRLQNNKGYPLPYGFDNYYLYIVRAEEVRIEGKVMRTNGFPVYLAIVSLAPSLPDELPTVLQSPALMLKGIVDYGDTIVPHFKKEKERLKKTLDSLRLLPEPPDEYQAEQFQLLLQKTADSLAYAEAHYELYRRFKNARGSGQSLIQFFLSYPFNRDLIHSIYARPYALPQYQLPSQTSPERKKHKKS